MTIGTDQGKSVHDCSARCNLIKYGGIECNMFAFNSVNGDCIMANTDTNIGNPLAEGANISYIRKGEWMIDVQYFIIYTHMPDRNIGIF